MRSGSMASPLPVVHSLSHDLLNAMSGSMRRCSSSVAAVIHDACAPSSRLKYQAGSVRAASRTAHCQDSPRPVPALLMMTTKELPRLPAAEKSDSQRAAPASFQWLSSSMTRKSGVKPYELVASEEIISS